MRIICISLLTIILSGCASTAQVYRDSEGRVEKIKYSKGQSFEIDGVKGDNKIDIKLFDMNWVKTGGK